MMVDIFGSSEACREWYIESGGGEWKLRKEYSPYLFDGLYLVLKELVYDFNLIKPVMLQRAAKKINDNFKRKFMEGAFKSVRKLTKIDMRKRNELLTEVIMDAMDPEEKIEARLFKRDEGGIIKNLWESQNGLCVECDGAIEESRMLDSKYTHIDHKVPYSKGGKTELGNAQLLHACCNKSKGAKCTTT
jgi:hypothetical protein